MAVNNLTEGKKKRSDTKKADGARQRVDGEPEGFARNEVEGDERGALGRRRNKL